MNDDLKFPVQALCLITKPNTGFSLFPLVTTSDSAFRYLTAGLSVISVIHRGLLFCFYTAITEMFL